MPIGQPQPIQKLAVGQRLYNFGFTDSVLFTEAYMRPRYKGSKLIGAKINEYTDYSQLTTNEYNSRLYRDDSVDGGILWNLIVTPGPPFATIRKDWLKNDFIRTTKPIDGTFPPLYEMVSTLSGYEGFINNSLFKGSLITSKIPGSVLAFTASGAFYGTVSASYSTTQGGNDIFNQDGTLKGKDGVSDPPHYGLIKYANAILAWECQYMGGYRRDRSYGRNPVIEVKTNTIYEFDWGGSTYPEIEKGGSVHIKQILNVDSYSKGNPNVYIVNEATNDSFRVDTTTVNGQGVSIVTDNPTEETDFSINLKRSLAYNDVITLDSYAPPLGPVSGPDDVVGGVNALIAATPPFPTKNVITLEPGLSVPSYGGVYVQRRVGTNTNYTSSLTGEPVGVPYLPRKESGEFGYKPVGDLSPEADFYTADFQNPGGPDVLASTLRNVSGSYYVPSSGSSLTKGTVSGGENPLIAKSTVTSDDWSYLKITPEGVYSSGSDMGNATIASQLSSSLANGNRHFVSFYETLGNVARGGLNQIGEPVEVKAVEGVGKIKIFLKSQPPITGSIGLGDIGILLWKAQQGPFAVMKPTNITADFSYNNLREGGFYRDFSILTIKQHFDDIVRTAGMKPSI